MEKIPNSVDPWEAEVKNSVYLLEEIPERFLHRFPVIRKVSKTGVVLYCEAVYAESDELRREKVPGFVHDPPGMIYHFLVARDSSGKILGTYVGVFVDEGSRMKITPMIRVLHKNQGLSTPIGEVFEQTLQEMANLRRLPIVFDLHNANLQKLEQYKAGDRIDPIKLKEMEQEQVRWQKLYGPGGKFKFDGEEKIFYPTKDDEWSVAS